MLSENEEREIVFSCSLNKDLGVEAPVKFMVTKAIWLRYYMLRQLEAPVKFLVTKTCGPDLLSKEWLETPVE